MSTIFHRVFILFSVIFFYNSSYATLIAGWDFETTTNGGTATVTSNSTSTVITPNSYIANFGSGNMYLDGTNNSSNWVSYSELTAYGGSNINTTGTSFSTSTSGASALAIKNNSANGKSIVFTLDMTGYTNLLVTYDAQGTSTGFTTHLWEYSTNGTSWTPITTLSSIPSTFAILSLPNISALNGISTSFLKLTVNGATGSSGNNRLDNIQFNATPATPLPVTWGDIKILEESKTLYWETLSEYNVDYFEVEGSKDAIEFKTISEPITTRDISHEVKTYTHFINESDLSYFRIKQVDIDSSYEYSPIVYRKNDYDAEVTNKVKVVYKNDQSFDYIKIENNTDDTEGYTIVDALGCIKNQTYILPKSVAKLYQENLHLENGLYFLLSDANKASQKIIVR